MLCHQPTPCGMDMIPIAKIRKLSYITTYVDFILVNFKNYPLYHKSSEMHKAAQNGSKIDNLGSFSLKILGILSLMCLYPSQATCYNRFVFQVTSFFIIILYFSLLRDVAIPIFLPNSPNLKRTPY